MSELWRVSALWGNGECGALGIAPDKKGAPKPAFEPQVVEVLSNWNVVDVACSQANMVAVTCT